MAMATALRLLAPDLARRRAPLQVYHFKSEEDLFARVGFAEAAPHKAIHDKFLSDAGGLTSIGDGEIAFIKNWLVVHIKGSDMHYAASFDGKGF